MSLSSTPQTLLLVVGTGRILVGLGAWFVPGLASEVFQIPRVVQQGGGGGQGALVTRLFGCRDFLLGLTMVYHVTAPPTAANLAVLDSFIRFGVVMDVIDTVASVIAWQTKAINNLGFTLIGVGAAVFAGFGMAGMRARSGGL